VIEQYKNTIKRPIIATADVKSQAYGRREETAATFLAAAAAADAYGSARLSGHPVMTLVVGQALSEFQPSLQSSARATRAKPCPLLGGNGPPESWAGP